MNKHILRTVSNNKISHEDVIEITQNDILIIECPEHMNFRDIDLWTKTIKKQIEEKSKIIAVGRGVKIKLISFEKKA